MSTRPTYTTQFPLPPAQNPSMRHFSIWPALEEDIVIKPYHFLDRESLHGHCRPSAKIRDSTDYNTPRSGSGGIKMFALARSWGQGSDTAGNEKGAGFIQRVWSKSYTNTNVVNTTCTFKQSRSCWIHGMFSFPDSSFSECLCFWQDVLSKCSLAILLSGWLRLLAWKKALQQQWDGILIQRRPLDKIWNKFSFVDAAVVSLLRQLMARCFESIAISTGLHFSWKL